MRAPTARRWPSPWWETRASLDALDDILAVDGIDGVLVGPSDLSIAWSGGAAIGAALDDMMPAIGEVAARTLAAGKIPATFATNAGMARRYLGIGYRMVAVSTDAGCLLAGAGALLSELRARQAAPAQAGA